MKGLFKIILATIITTGVCYQEVSATDVDNGTEDTTTENSWDLSENTREKSENIILDGMIGPYDPNDPNKADDPNFDGIPTGELEGELPTDNYYTISVTVPTSMHFTVVSGWGRGQFYSPKYTIENKATRPIYITVKELTEEDFSGDEEFDKLYLRTPVHYDNNIEIDVSLSMMNKNTLTKQTVRLSEFSASDTTQNHYLGVLGLKESGILQFESNNWDVPGLDAPDKHAKNDFTLQLEFSLENPKNPTEPTEPPGSTDSEQPTDSPGSEEQIQP